MAIECLKDKMLLDNIFKRCTENIKSDISCDTFKDIETTTEKFNIRYYFSNENIYIDDLYIESYFNNEKKKRFYAFMHDDEGMLIDCEEEYDTREEAIRHIFKKLLETFKCYDCGMYISSSGKCMECLLKEYRKRNSNNKNKSDSSDEESDSDNKDDNSSDEDNDENKDKEKPNEIIQKTQESTA